MFINKGMVKLWKITIRILQNEVKNVEILICNGKKRFPKWIVSWKRETAEQYVENDIICV